MLKEFELEVSGRSAACHQWSINCEGVQFPGSDYVDWALAAWLKRCGKLFNALERGLTLVVADYELTDASAELRRRFGSEYWTVTFEVDEPDAPAFMPLCLDRLRQLGFTRLDSLWVRVEIPELVEPVVVELVVPPKEEPKPEVLESGITILKRGLKPNFKPPEDHSLIGHGLSLEVQHKDRKAVVTVIGDMAAREILNATPSGSGQSKRWAENRRKRILATLVDITDMVLPKCEILLSAHRTALKRKFASHRILTTRWNYARLNVLLKEEARTCRS